MSDRKVKVACVQLRCGDDVAENVRTASALIRDAHKMGAQFIGTPEKVIRQIHALQEKGGIGELAIGAGTC